MKQTILVIDDDFVSLKTTESILKKRYNVICADSGIQGLMELTSQKIDMIILDLMMPGMSGTEFLRRIREHAEVSSIPVLVVTSTEYQGDILEVNRLGVDEIVHKPVFPSELMTYVRKCLPGYEKEHILIVDDEAMNHMLTKKILDKLYDVECCFSGKEALESIRQRRPALILLDLHMPDMDGMEVLEAIKKLPECKKVPVMILTADENPDVEIEIFRKGAIDFIRKPMVPDIVKFRIARILELYTLQNNLQGEVDKKIEQIRENNQRILNLTSQVMLALSGTIDAKDHYTNGHSTRVARYSREIARRMGKSDQMMNDIFYIALLHDIGKVGILDEIINKKDTLTNEEYNEIKRHPVIGYQILEKITEMPDLACGAHWHHERFDGNGYPDGLSGLQIPEIARIIGVADAYDAMTSKRSYRDSLPQEVVKQELIRGRGTQFDPEITDIMLQIIEEDKDYILHE